MTLTCPHCGYSRLLPVDKVPSGPARVTCPKCRQAFRFGGGLEGESQGVVSCPTCGSRQPAGQHCENCGIQYRHPEPEGAATGATATNRVGTPVLPISPDQRPKAGFWVRFAALILDGLLVCVVQFLLTLALGVIIGWFGGENPQATSAMTNLAVLVVVAIGSVYYVFFTGYGGQTPGKMAVRIKVIRRDGGEVGFGRALLREILGKFISGLIFFLGYLMAGFDRQKQGLHDKIADTYVVKL